jgi:hypothetical protein
LEKKWDRRFDITMQFVFEPCPVLFQNILLKIDDCKLNLYVSLIMTLICLDPCQWSLMSLITGNKVKKKTQAKVL